MVSEFEKIATEEYVSVNTEGTEKLRCLLHVKESNSTKNLVLIPGYNSLPSAWDILVMEMKDDYNIWLFETREKYTAILPENASFEGERFAKDVAKLIEYYSLQDQEYIVLASSMSSLFVEKALVMQIINPKRAYLVGPLLKPPVPRWGYLLMYLTLPLTWYLFLKPLSKAYIGWIKLRRDQKEQRKKYHHYLDTVNFRRLRKTSIYLKNFEISEEELTKIKTECILVDAEKDTAHETEIVKIMKEHIEKASSYTLETNIDTHTLPMVELIRKLEQTE